MKTATKVRVASLAALAVGVFAFVGWYVFEATRPTGFGSLKESAARMTSQTSAVTPSGTAKSDSPSSPNAPAALSATSDPGLLALSGLIAGLPTGLSKSCATTRGWCESDAPMSSADLPRLASLWSRNYFATADARYAPVLAGEAEASAARAELDAYEARFLAGEASTDFPEVLPRDRSLPIVLCLVRALDEGDESRFVALAQRALDTYDPEEGIASAEWRGWPGGPGPMLIAGLRGVVFSACEEGLLGEESLRQLAQAAAARRLSRERADDLWAAYCVRQTDVLRAAANRLPLNTQRTWGCFMDGRPNRAVSSAMLPIYERRLESLAVAWAAKDLREIKRCSDAERAMRGRMNLTVEPRSAFGPGMETAIGDGIHPLAEVVDWSYSNELYAMELRIAAERWSLDNQGRRPGGLDDLVPQRLSPPETLDPRGEWAVCQVDGPAGAPVLGVLFLHPAYPCFPMLWMPDGKSYRALAHAILGSARKAAPAGTGKNGSRSEHHGI